MSDEKIMSFLNLLRTDVALQQKFRAADSNWSSFIAIAKSAGFDFSESEMKMVAWDVMRLRQVDETVNLTDEDLEGVSGGTMKSTWNILRTLPHAFFGGEKYFSGEHKDSL